VSGTGVASTKATNMNDVKSWKRILMSEVTNTKDYASLNDDVEGGCNKSKPSAFIRCMNKRMIDGST
jgi:hypothetical protein